MNKQLKKWSRPAGLASVLILISLFAGCAPKYVAEDGRLVQLQRAEFMPRPYELKYNKARVAITITDKTKDIGVKANLSKIFENAIEKYVAEAGAEIVSLDAGQNKELTELIGRVEQRSSRKPVSESADYAIWGVISSVELDNEYIAPEKRENGETTEPRCRYRATASGMLRIYGLAEEQIIESLNIYDTASDSKDTTNSSCLITSSIVNLIRKAAENAIDDQSTRLKNFFAPRGYISERRVCDGKNYFKITLGKNYNLEPGVKVIIYTKYTQKDPFTDEIKVEEKRIAEGEVSDLIENNFAWVTLDDEDRADKIRLGDYGKIRFEKGIFRKTIDDVQDFGEKIIN